MPDQRPEKRSLLRQRLANPEVRDRIFRIVSISLILVLAGACVVLVMGLVMELEVVVVVFSGVATMALAFYLFIHLWPERVESESKVGTKIAKALEKPAEKPLSPEEYRKQREMAQKMIRDKAAPALAKAIRGILRQEELKDRRQGGRGR